MSAIERSDAAEAVHRENTAARLTSIEDTLKWLVRLVIGGILGALVAYAMNGGLVIG